MFTPAERKACLKLVALALAEDLGATGDCTSNAIIPIGAHGSAAFVSRSLGVLAGLPAVELVCAVVDPQLQVEDKLADGSPLVKGTKLATITGPMRSLLAAERTALNFLQRMSGIATATKSCADLVAGWNGRILDTRKTAPGWRLLEKYAVRMGGGHNHRIGLYDAILIKDNHIAAISASGANPLRRAVEMARAHPGNAGLAVEIEVDGLEQLNDVLPAKPEIVLLDNMPVHAMRAAVALRNQLSPDTLLEASGGITKETIRAIADTGIDRISIGALTHSAPALDIGLDYLTDV